MTFRNSIKLGIIFVMGFLGIFGFAWAREIVIQNARPEQLTPAPTVQSTDLLAKIEEGKNLLKKSKPLSYEFKKNSKGKLTTNLYRKQIALAILNKNTGEVFEKRVWVKEADINNYSKTKILQLTSALVGESLNIQPKWWNSFNTYYEIENRPELVIVANKYPMQSTYLTSLPERSKNKFTEIIYAPYSKTLHTTELIAAGKKYIENSINLAFAELDNKQVFSRDDSTKLVTEKLSKDFIKTIILVEHVDPDAFNIADDGGKELTERVLTIIGANQDLAYRYTGSPAGANGLAQFIKPTYNTIVSKYPEAKLIKNYNLGMTDHKNAMQAMVLFFDNYGKDIDNKVSRRDVLSQIGITEEMLAAAYNGGPNRVVSSVNKFGMAWLTGQLNLPRASKIFKKETLDYVKKFQSIRELKLF